MFQWVSKDKNGKVTSQSNEGSLSGFLSLKAEEIDEFYLLPEDKRGRAVALKSPDNSKVVFFKQTQGNSFSFFPEFTVIGLGIAYTDDDIEIDDIIEYSQDKALRGSIFIYPDGTIEVGRGQPELLQDYAMRFAKRQGAKQ